MKIKYLLTISILIYSCKPKLISENNNYKFEKAKWFFYSYASPNKAYTQNAQAFSPWECEVKNNGLKKVGQKTTEYYFRFFIGDTLNYCTLKPYDLIGVQVNNDTVYLPIYNHVAFDNPISDSASFAIMTKSEAGFKDSLKVNKSKTVEWLKNHDRF